MKKENWSSKAKRNWGNTIFMVLLPISAFLTSVYYFYTKGWDWKIVGLFFLFYFATGISITAGYHRLFSHKGYEAHPFVEFLYLVFGAAAFQNSALKWCTDHRIHHRYVDGDDDPYSIRRGFWYAHVGWVCHEGNPKDFSRYNRDLRRNSMVLWQDKYYVSIAFLAGGVLPTLIGWSLGSALGGFAVAGLLRIVVVHHFTFFINSACHYWGKQTYTDSNSARDNAFLAFFTYGEGFHNFHHLFHNDYRNGIRWFDYDPTKWWIYFLSFFGGTRQLKRTPKIKILQAKMTMEQKRLQRHLTSSVVKDLAEQMKEKVECAYEKWDELKLKYQYEYKILKKQKTVQGKEKIKLLKLKMREAKLEYDLACLQWRQHVLSLTPA